MSNNKKILIIINRNNKKMPEKNYDTNDLPTNSYGVEYDKDMYLANDRYAYFIDKEIEINKKNLKK